MTIANLPVIKNSLEAYLSQINQFPLLTQEEEFKLAVRYRKYNDIEAAHKLITANLRSLSSIRHMGLRSKTSCKREILV